MSIDQNNDTPRDNSAEAPAPAVAAGGAGKGGNGRKKKPPPAVESPASPRRRGGYKTPPVDKQFKSGQSGNPSGKRKKPQLPRHIGNQIDGITTAIIAELNFVMMHGIPKGMPKGRYAGAKLYARMFFKDATTKEGFARKQLFALYHGNRQYLDIFRPKGKSAAEADELSMMIKAVMDPTLTPEEFHEILKKLEDDKSERYGLD